MKAMILAAGLGTRLQPLTCDKPKALVEAGGVSMLERLILKLKLYGFRTIVINVHHFAEQIIQFLHLNNNFGLKIYISDETDEILETGGALKKAISFFGENEDFLLHNVDVYSKINLQAMMNVHQEHKNMVTLAVRNRVSSRKFLFDENKRLCGWEKAKAGIVVDRIGGYEAKNVIKMAFSGIHIINSQIFASFPEESKFSIVNFYLHLAKVFPIEAYEHRSGFWFDLGKIPTIEKVNRMIKRRML